MEARRPSRAVIDPKVRHVGFFAPVANLLPGQNSTSLSGSPAGNSLSPVMIPPPRHPSDRTPAVPVPDTGLRRQGSDHVPVGSYNPSESLLSSSPAPSSPSGRVGLGDGEFSEESDGWYRYRRSGSGKFDLTLPDTTLEKAPDNPGKSSAAPVLESKKPVHVPGNNAL
jgi:translation initiation factor eIF-2B subunit delta